MRNRGEKLVAQLMQEHDGCLIFLDMDNLKKINDIYGHKAGDRALRLLGHICCLKKSGLQVQATATPSSVDLAAMNFCCLFLMFRKK